MDMANSLRQLDEYLKKVESFAVNSEEHAPDIALETGGESSDRLEKSDNSFIVEKSIDLHQVNIENPSSEAQDITEKSNLLFGDFTPSLHNTITSSESSEVGIDADVNKDTVSDATYFKGDLSDNVINGESDFIVNVKTEALHIEESENASQELAEIGFNEENLEQLYLNGTQSSIIVPEGDIETFNKIVPVSQVIPVALTKSTVTSEDIAVPKPPKGQVTTLMDLSSIGELKRLWAKSDKPVRKTQNVKNRNDLKCGSALNTRKIASRIKAHHSTQWESIDDASSSNSTEECDTKFIIDSVTSSFSVMTEPSLNKEIHSLAPVIKACSVKLERLESLLIPTGLHVDLRVPSMTVSRIESRLEPPDSVKGDGQSKLYGKISRTKTAVANSLKNVYNAAKKNKVSTLSKKKKATKVKARKSKSSGVNLNCFKVETKADRDCVEIEDIEYDDYESIDFDNKTDDDYVPSDDCYDEDFRPYKKKKERVQKATNSISKLGISSKLKSGKKQKGVRIGKPPVFGRFECKHCDYVGDWKSELDRHHKKYHRTVKLTCEHCDKTFRTMNAMLEHQAYKHDGGKPFKCKHEGCGYASKNPVDLKRHQAKHATELKHVCELCGWRTKWIRNLRSHHFMKHCDIRKFKCGICGFAAKRNTDLKDHMYRHTDEKPIQCLVCGFRVKTNWELRSHMLVHSEERPFKCDFPGCSRSTKTKADLNKHMRIHQADQPCVCPICLKKYKNQPSLNKHITGIHVPEKRFKCDVCGKDFRNKYALRKHMYVHAGYRPYACPICNWKFSTRCNMEKHMVTHDASVRPYPCPLCPHAAKQPDHLLAHIGTVHGHEYAYFCELCQKPFKRYTQLKVHYERCHTGKEVQKLKNSSIDLALLKIEMKLESEEGGKGKRKRGRPRKKPLCDVEIKEEVIDPEFGDNVREEEDISDVRLNENTGEIEVVRKKRIKHSQSNEELNKTADGQMETVEINDNFIGEYTSTLNENLGNSASNLVEVDSLGQVIGSSQEEGIMDQVETKESVVIAKHESSTVALYEDMRLPLATRGFKFNYNKNGTKPMKAWFMDVSLMDNPTAERHKKHRRRLGLLPPIPRGHPPKGYKRLIQFVDKRKKQLSENIKKAKITKDLGLVAKRNVSRNNRFQGKYTEFETANGEELSLTQVQEIIPKLEDETGRNVKQVTQTNEKVSKIKKDNMKSKAYSKSKVAGTQKKVTSGKQAVKKIKKLGEKIKKIANSKNGKGGKVLLTSEKLKSGSKCENLKIRKPKFLVKAETNVNEIEERDSFEALKNILKEFDGSEHAGPLPKEKDDKTKCPKGKTPKPKPGRPLKSNNQDKTTKSKKAGRPKSNNVDKTPKPSKPGKTPKSKKPDKPLNAKKPGRPANSNKTGKSATSNKPAKSPNLKTFNKHPNAKKETKQKYNKKYVPVKFPAVKRKKKEVDQTESNKNKKKLKLSSGTSQKEPSVDNSDLSLPTLQNPVFGPTMHIPVQDTKLVMVYPTCVVQNEIPLALPKDNVEVFVSPDYRNPEADASNENAPNYVNQEAAESRESPENRKDLIEIVRDSSNCEVVAPAENKDRSVELKSNLSKEPIVVKEEPLNDLF